VSALTGSDSISTILNLVYLGVFVVFMFFSPKIQALLTMRQTSHALTRLTRTSPKVPSKQQREVSGRSSSYFVPSNSC